MNKQEEIRNYIKINDDIYNYIKERFGKVLDDKDSRYITQRGEDSKYIDMFGEEILCQTRNHYIKMMKSIIKGLKDKNLI